jgi:DNA-binding MarR family transcriptional regulator
MAATVKDLADAGFVSAGPDPDDARKKILSLTEAGDNALDTDRRQRAALLAAALHQALDEDELRALARALDLLDRVSVAVNRITAT